MKKKDDNFTRTLKEKTAGYYANERLLKNDEFGKEWYLDEPYNMTGKEWRELKGAARVKDLSQEDKDIYTVLKYVYNG